MLKVQRLTKTAQLPKRQHKGDAGYDLSSDEDIVIYPGEWKLVSTGIAFTVPNGTYGRIAPRSGFSYKKGTMIGAGVVDEAYCGEVKVLVFNLSKVEINIKQGDRIAQLILEKIETPEVIEVESLKETERGSGGFGSTGK
jgi:dUTP pyrophosphatase